MEKAKVFDLFNLFNVGVLIQETGSDSYFSLTDEIITALSEAGNITIDLIAPDYMDSKAMKYCSNLVTASNHIVVINNGPSVGLEPTLIVPLTKESDIDKIFRYIEEIPKPLSGVIFVDDGLLNDYIISTKMIPLSNLCHQLLIISSNKLLLDTDNLFLVHDTELHHLSILNGFFNNSLSSDYIVSDYDNTIVKTNTIGNSVDSVRNVLNFICTPHKNKIILSGNNQDHFIGPDSFLREAYSYNDILCNTIFSSDLIVLSDGGNTYNQISSEFKVKRLPVEDNENSTLCPEFCMTDYEIDYLTEVIKSEFDTACSKDCYLENRHNCSLVIRNIPTQVKRYRLYETLSKRLPEYNIIIAGTRSIDITKESYNKCKALQHFIEHKDDIKVLEDLEGNKELTSRESNFMHKVTSRKAIDNEEDPITVTFIGDDYTPGGNDNSFIREEIDKNLKFNLIGTNGIKKATLFFQALKQWTEHRGKKEL